MTNLTKTIDSLGLEFRLVGELPAEITGISVDSRQTKPGHMFAAMPGSNVHGAEFVKYAVRMGAVAVLTDESGYEVVQAEGGYDLPFLIADDPRMALSKAAAGWFGAQPETIVAITGTNGKNVRCQFYAPDLGRTWFGCGEFRNRWG